jgi:hypothetical protein
VPDYGLVWGNPACLHGFVAPNGERLVEKSRTKDSVIAGSPGSSNTIEIPLEIWEKIE